MERKRRWRVGIHFFRVGVHVKLRRGDVYRHFVIKVARASAFGKPRARTHLWVGWWESHKGVKRELNGFRFVAAFDRLPACPRDTIPIPFYPQSGRDPRLGGRPR